MSTISFTKLNLDSSVDSSQYASYIRFCSFSFTRELHFSGQEISGLQGLGSVTISGKGVNCFSCKLVFSETVSCTISDNPMSPLSTLGLGLAVGARGSVTRLSTSRPFSCDSTLMGISLCSSSITVIKQGYRALLAI